MDADHPAPADRAKRLAELIASYDADAPHTGEFADTPEEPGHYPDMPWDELQRMVRDGEAHEFAGRAIHMGGWIDARLDPPAPAVEPVDLEGIKARLARMPEGPWGTRPEGFSGRVVMSMPPNGYPAYICHVASGHQYNGEFLAHSWADIHTLLALVASQAAEIAGLRAEVARLAEYEAMYKGLCK